MIRNNRKLLALAVAVSALSRYVDALGFLSLGGFFVSFMSGNLTRLGAAIAADSLAVALIPAAIILLFVVGVIAGSLIGRSAGAAQRTTLMMFVAVALTAAAVSNAFGFQLLAIAAIVIAMGAINTLFETDGATSIPVTYMTGTLVRMAQGIASALRGGSRLEWLRYLTLWLGLVLGAVLGAYAYGNFGLSGLWIAAFAASSLIPIVYALETD